MKNYIYLFLIGIATIIVSCEDDNSTDNEETTKMVSITNQISEDENFSIELLANDTLFEGYNKLYFELKNEQSGEKITNADISLKPIMNMLTMKHSAPFENPENLANTNGYFEGAVVFIMPSNPDEGWTLDVAVESASVKDTIHLVIPIVKSVEEARKINIISAFDSARYFVSLVEPSDPKVGMNELEFAVHYRENMMSFPADEGVTITFEPEMPSMGHGSPNNENPVHNQNGHYKGKVNFTMTGWWRLNLQIMHGNDTISKAAYFDVTF